MHLNKAKRNARQGMSLLTLLYSGGEATNLPNTMRSIVTLPKTSGSSKRRNQGCYGTNASATIEPALLPKCFSISC